MVDTLERADEILLERERRYLEFEEPVTEAVMGSPEWETHIRTTRQFRVERAFYGRQQLSRFMDQGRMEGDEFKYVLGERLGAGISRAVYVYAPDPRWVIKVRHGAAAVEFWNVLEWETYVHAVPEFSKWLAPCLCLSADGRILIQRRCDPLPTDRLPTRLPKALIDEKPENFGLLDGRPVAIDYGRNYALVLAGCLGDRAADWRDDRGDISRIDVRARGLGRTLERSAPRQNPDVFATLVAGGAAATGMGGKAPSATDGREPPGATS